MLTYFWQEQEHRASAPAKILISERGIEMKKLVKVCCTLLLIFLVIRVGFHIAFYDEYWSNFTKEMKEEFPMIKKIEASHVGPHYNIYTQMIM